MVAEGIKALVLYNHVLLIVDPGKAIGRSTNTVVIQSLSKINLFLNCVYGAVNPKQ